MKNQVEKLLARLDVWGAKLQKKDIRIPVDLAAGIFFFLFAAIVLFILPQQVTVSDKDVVNGRVFPTMLMIVMMICCALLILKELFKLAAKKPLTMKTINLLVEVKALVILGILLAFYFLSRVTGLFVIGAIFCCIGFLFYFRCKKPLYYVITLLFAVSIWAVFRFLLNVNF